MITIRYLGIVHDRGKRTVQRYELQNEKEKLQRILTQEFKTTADLKIKGKSVIITNLRKPAGDKKNFLEKPARIKLSDWIEAYYDKWAPRLTVSVSVR